MLGLINQIKNNVFSGLVIGLAIPSILLFGIWYLMQHVLALQKADLLLVACVAVNLFLMNYFFKQNKENVARGVLSATFLWAFAFFYYKVF